MRCCDWASYGRTQLTAAPCGTLGVCARCLGGCTEFFAYASIAPVVPGHRIWPLTVELQLWSCRWHPVRPGVLRACHISGAFVGLYTDYVGATARPPTSLGVALELDPNNMSSVESSSGELSIWRYLAVWRGIRIGKIGVLAIAFKPRPKAAGTMPAAFGLGLKATTKNDFGVPAAFVWSWFVGNCKHPDFPDTNLTPHQPRQPPPSRVQ